MMYNSKSTKKNLSTVLLMILVMLPTMTNGRIANHQSPLLNPHHDPRRRRLLVLLAVVAFPEAILSKALAASKTSKHHNDISYGKSSVSSHSILLERRTTRAESRDNSVRSISSSTTTSLLPEFMIRRRDANLQMSFYWEQIGNSIYGEAAGDQSGFRVGMSDDGGRVIIGAPYNGGNGKWSGHARVYQDVDGTWMQVGEDLRGEYSNDFFGGSVGMSSDGRRVIIGATGHDWNGSSSGHARVYEDVDGTWKQVGEDLRGEAVEDVSGASVAMSSDGRRVIIGAPGNDGNGSRSGHARVYQDVDGTWMQVGEDLRGEAAGDESGSVAMSSDGRRVIIGAPGNDGNGSTSGHARVYQDVDGTWMQVGEDLDGEAAGDESGSVGMNSDGRRVIIAARYNDGNGSDSGHARVYEDVDGTWMQVGEDLGGEAAGDESGSVAMSSDGRRVIIGARYNDGNGSNSGHARVYEDVDGTWMQVGEDLDGEYSNDYFGGSVGMSSDGRRVIIGAQYNDGNGLSSGQVRVFAAVTTSSPSEVSTASPAFSPAYPEDSDLAGSSLLIVWITAPVLVLLIVVLLVCLYRWHSRQKSLRNDATPPAASASAAFKQYPGIKVDEELHSDYLIELPQEIINNEYQDHPQQPLFLYDAFLTHNWGLDSQNRDNHKRVVNFKKYLEKKFGMDSLWLDEERMTGDIVQQMCDGIDNSRFVIVFITQKYIDKVASRGPKGDRDNCRLEFNYAALRKGPSKLIAVVMEDACSKTDEWDRAVGMHLGGQLFFSFKEDSELHKCAKLVYEEIQKRSKQEEDE